MPRLPQISGRDLIRLLHSLGYETVGQRGSHIRLVKVTRIGEHHITVAGHKILAKGTLSDVLMHVSWWNGIPKEELIDRLRYTGSNQGMKKYLVVIEPTNSGYSSYCPDLPGCVSTGPSGEEAERNMREAIEFHVDGLRKEGYPVPEPHTTSSYVDLPA